MQRPSDLTQQFLIYSTHCECTTVSSCEPCKAIESLGGVKTDNGFSFPSATERSAALEVLGEKFGNRYFERG
jgi:hypothetical protein